MARTPCLQDDEAAAQCVHTQEAKGDITARAQLTSRMTDREWYSQELESVFLPQLTQSRNSQRCGLKFLPNYPILLR